MAEAPTTLDRLVGFARYLRTCGIPVAADRSLSFTRAACLLDPLSLGSVYEAGRVTLVSDPEHEQPYKEAFLRYFLGTQEPEEESDEPPSGPEEEQTRDGEDGDERDSAGVAPEAGAATDERGRAASEVEVLRVKSFEELDDEERSEVWRSIREMKIRLPQRRSRRLTARHRGAKLDLRRTMRESLRTGGEPVRRRWRSRRHSRRPLVLLLDVSGSMAPYSRTLLQFGHAVAAAGARVEVFIFGTRLTRITRMLAHRDPDIALQRLSSPTYDWEGGTKIGVSLKQLVHEFSQSSALRRALVIICSDGLDRGEPEILAHQMERLHRLAHRIVWVNPLKADPRYEPLARGMKAALPCVDEFISGHNMSSLYALAQMVGDP